MHVSSYVADTGTPVFIVPAAGYGNMSPAMGAGLLSRAHARRSLSFREARLTCNYC